MGLFSFWSGEYNRGTDIRFGYIENEKLYYSFGKIASVDDGRFGGWPENEHPYNQIPVIGDVRDKEIYISIIINPNKIAESDTDDDITQSIFLNIVDGEKIDSKFESTWLSKKYFDSLVNYGNECKYLEMGRCAIGEAGGWFYLKGTCYMMRIYNKALTEDEARANFEVTKTYHDYITEMNKKL